MNGVLKKLMPAVVAASCVALSAIAETPPATHDEALFTEESTIDDYLDYALKNNAGLRAAWAKVQAAEASITTAGSLDDPQLSFEYMFEQHDMQYGARLTQMIPGPGKLSLRQDSANAMAEAAHHDYEAMRFMVFENVVKAFQEYHYLERAIQVTGENVALVTDLEKVMMERYKSGSARYSHLLKTQVEKDKLADMLAGMEDMRSVTSARLSALLNLPTSTILPWPTATESGTVTLPEDILFDMLRDLNPELKAMDSTIESLDSSVRLARRSYMPDFMVGAGYMVMPEMDDGSTPTDGSLMIGLTLPIWWGKYNAEIREAEYSRESAASRQAQLRNDLKADLKTALFDLHDAERKIALFEDSLIPKAKQAYEVTRQEFMNGSAQFMDLIDAQRSLLEFELMLERSKADRETALGEIGCCVGRFDLGVSSTDGTTGGDQ